MMSKRSDTRNIKRHCLKMATAVMMLTMSQHALAQQPPPWELNGSDTWFDVITQALITSNADCPGTDQTDTISNLVYVGGGSSTAESNMGNNIQSVGPMSRNFKQSVMDAHLSWIPSVRNVGGLDAGVIITKSTTSKVKNINLPLHPEASTEANCNDPAVLPFNFGQTGSGYTQLMAIVLGGIDGSGSVPACSHPRRIQAVQDLAAYQGIASIEHFYRRDDNSGTTDTFKEKLQICNFCNGRARGIKGSNPIDPNNNNLNNQDNDPIRRPCPPSDPALGATTCTDMITGLACTHGDGNSNCTQGLVVAISDPDPGQTDVTVSIGVRVGKDPTGQLMGYAGREGYLQSGASAPFLNTNDYSNALVRLDQYMLSRRLFIQYGNDITDAAQGGANQVSTELKFWNWLTEPAGDNCNFVPGRCNLDPILESFGFIPCTDDCLTEPSGSSNLCSKAPYPPAGNPRCCTSTANCIPAYSNGTPWGYEAVACSAGQICCSTGEPCPAGNMCPAVGGLNEFDACTEDSDCAAGYTCYDALGIGTKVCSF